MSRLPRSAHRTWCGGWWFTLFTAILGSVVLLWIVGMVQRKA